ncbi:MAG: hypothetical protein EOM92_19705 [Gammaproteobacteria bacterium]|nr:hypothetical protein [Gammaproteobacteria bacterium]
MNMSYCRFQNTATDFRDCLENLRSLEPEDRDHNTANERRARRELILDAATLMQELGVDDVFDTHALLRLVDALDQEPAEEFDD